VINTSLPPILHRFRDIAFDSSKIFLSYPDGGAPLGRSP